MMTSPEALAQCAELRFEEWTVLSSVYPEYTSLSDVPSADSTTSTTIRLEIPIEFEETSSVDIECEESLSPSEQRLGLSLSNLPPLILTLLLPPSYPLKEPPLTMHIHVLNAWLSATDIQKVADRLRVIWQEDLSAGGSGSLWRTFDWIRSGAFLEEIGRSDSSRVRLIHPKPSLLAERLRSHEDTIKDSLFNHSKFDCQICLESVKGSQCIRLLCGHIFCRPCLTEFWSLCIREGDVDRVMCAHEACVKEGRPITEDEVTRVVTASEVQRWKALKKKRALEKDPGLVYCTVCQGPCPTPKDHQGDLGPVDDTVMRRRYISLRECENCGYSFCIVCKRAWHALAPCSSDVTSKLVEKYMSLESDDPERLALEMRFGKAQLARLVEKIKEDMENKKWLEGQTTPCPNCSVAVEKSQGCNHMTCARCLTHFCYLCGIKLPGDDPYAHFGTPGPCKGQLFQAANWDPEEFERPGFLIFD